MSDPAVLSDLKNVVLQTLESSGVLSNFRAQLRRHVYEAIEEHEKENTNANKKSPSQKLRKEFISTDEGQLLTHLIIDFLQTLNLEHTLSVFHSELSLEKMQVNKNQLAARCQIKQLKNEIPLLAALLQQSKLNSTNNSPRQLFRDTEPVQSSSNTQISQKLQQKTSDLTSLKNLPNLQPTPASVIQPQQPEIDEEYSTGVEEELSFEEEVGSVPNTQKLVDDVNSDYPSDVYSQDPSVAEGFDQEFDYIEPVE